MRAVYNLIIAGCNIVLKTRLLINYWGMMVLARDLLPQNRTKFCNAGNTKYLTVFGGTTLRSSRLIITDSENRVWREHSSNNSRPLAQCWRPVCNCIEVVTDFLWDAINFFNALINFTSLVRPGRKKNCSMQWNFWYTILWLKWHGSECPHEAIGHIKVGSKPK